MGETLAMKISTKNVRIPDDLIVRLDSEASRTGRTRNAELVALLEEAIIQIKYTTGYSLTDSFLIPEDEEITMSVGDSYQIRIPHTLEDAVAHDVPRLIQPSDGASQTVYETFSEKVRYLLMRGLTSRGAVISVELESIRGSVYQDKEVEEKFKACKKGSSRQLDQMLDLAGMFEEYMLGTQGHVLAYGGPGTGKSFCTGYFKTANPGVCHFIDLIQVALNSSTGSRAILLWANENNYNEKKTLILDDAHRLDSEYLAIFLKKANKKNVRVIITAQSERDLDENVLGLIDLKINFNLGRDGKASWLESVKGRNY